MLNWEHRCIIELDRKVETQQNYYAGSRVTEIILAYNELWSVTEEEFMENDELFGK